MYVLEMKARGRYVAPNHIASKCQSWDSHPGVSRVGGPNLCSIISPLSKFSELSMLLGTMHLT